jgi:hypothetical protein
MKKSKTLKILSIFLCSLLILQQTGFAQVASVELNIAGRFAFLQNTFTPDKFRPLHLRSISYNGLNNSFNLLLDKGDSVVLPAQEIKDTTKDLLNYFFVGLALPNNSFWVNLRPDSPNDVIDPFLAETEVGRILLEADLQLKKDTADAINPATVEGREYWNKLYQKAGEIYGDQNVTIPTLTRPWIVPDEIIIRESTGSAYIYKATLKVMLEQDYLNGNTAYSFKDPREKQLNEYSSQIIRERIIPRLNKEINSAKRYAPLRQVYYSLILAQWFKARNQNNNTPYSRRINRKDLTGLRAKTAYSVADYFNAYKENFAKGQYNIKEPMSTPYGQVVRSYFSGGANIDLKQIPEQGDLAFVNPVTKASTTIIPGNSNAEDNDISVRVDGDGGSLVVYFDPEQGEAMMFLEKDSQAWVVFSDMLKLSLRNDYYGSDIADVFIEDAVLIVKKVLSRWGGIGFRLGERRDEVAMVLPGSLAKETVENVLQDIQEEIRKEYAGYRIARLPDGIGEKIKDSGAIEVRAIKRTVRFRDGELEYLTTVFFKKDGDDPSGRLTLSRILAKSKLDHELGEIQEVYPPYLPAGAVRLSEGGSIEDRFESSQKEAEIFQRVAKQEGRLVGVAGLIEKPEVREGAKLGEFALSGLENYVDKFRNSLQNLRGFVEERYNDNNRAKQIGLDNSYAAFMRSNLHDILEYVIEKAKSADRSMFVVRGPPDSFYFITSDKGKWQVTLVRQNILTAEGSSLEKDFLSIIEKSGRDRPPPGKYPFKVINDSDELGHYFGNQLIALDNLSLLDAFSRLSISEEAGVILSKKTINNALQEASERINGLLKDSGFKFSVSFVAISLTNEDFTGTVKDVTKTALDVIDKMSAGRPTVVIADNAVEFYSEYQGDIEKEIGVIAAERASNAQTELERVYASIKAPENTAGRNDLTGPGDIFGSRSAVVFAGEEVTAELPGLINAANETLSRDSEDFVERIFLLFGTTSQEGYQVKKIVALPKSAYFEQSYRYAEAKPQEIAEIIDKNATGDNKLLGVLHTHPFDLVKMLKNPGPSWQDGLGEDIIPVSRKDKIIDRPFGVVIEATVPASLSIEDAQEGNITAGINAYFYLTENNAAKVFKVVDFNEWVNQINGGQSDQFFPPDNPSGDDKGGIDFRFLPIVNQSMDSLKASLRAMSQSNLQRISLTQEWSSIERLVNAGITPSAERLEEYFAASNLKGNLDSDRAKIVSCISDILRMEEQDYSATDQTLKDILVVLGSGRNAEELKSAFAN